MIDAEAHPVLRCGHCNKPFDKESSLKRHGYYCRSRSHAPHPRHRSCVACAKAKVRCGPGPTCSRCASRGIQCRFPGRIQGLQSGDQERDFHEVPSSNYQKEADEFAFSAGVSSTYDNGFDTTLGLTNFDVTDYALPIQQGNSSKGFNWLLPPEELPIVPIAQHRLNRDDLIASTCVSIPPTPGFNVRSLVPRSQRHIGSQRNMQLILHILQSYGHAMSTRKTLPPFIHSSSASTYDQDAAVESLGTCISLMRIFGGNVPSGRKLFWRNVHMECHRIRQQAEWLGPQELLGAMQALAIYVSVRLSEGETDYNNLDELLVTTVTIVSQEFMVRLTTDLECGSDEHHPDDPDLRWKEWIFEESCRRICVIYRVVNLLVHFEPAAKCDKTSRGLLIAPLPAGKDLWEAETAASWFEQGNGCPEKEPSYALTTNGDLIVLDWHGEHEDMYSPANTGSQQTSSKNWQAWCSGMDAMSGLIMLAASLTE